jgi:hypothetical protein
MNARINITLMTPDASLASAVSAALHANGHVVAGPPVRDMRDLAPQLGRSPVPVVLVDLDPAPHQVLSQLERIIARHPTTRFVALSSSVGNELLLEAMQTGVRRVVTKQTMNADLPGVLDRLTAPDLKAGPGGEILTVLSASGGCGATTIAVNLAEEIALRQKQPTLLCDLDGAYGAVASYLGLSPRYGADHVFHYSGDIDAQLIRSTATVHNDRIHVLASPASMNLAAAGEPLRFERLEPSLLRVLSGGAYAAEDAGRFHVLYLYDGDPVLLDLLGVAGPLKSEWFDPRTGTFSPGPTLAGNGLPPD